MSSPTYTGLSSYDLLDSAMSQPLSLTSTLYEEGKGGALESFGLGTVLRGSQVPLPAPSRDAPYGFDPNGLAVPPDISPQDYLQGTWITPEMIDKKRQEMGALTDDQYKASPSYRQDIPYDPGMTETRAAALASMDDAKKVREFYAQKRPLAAFLGSMAGQALDPINYVPVAGPAVKAAAIGRFGRITGEALTAGLDAAANTAVFGIGTSGMRAQLGDDVSWQALVSQIATAGLIGSAFGTIHGAIGSRVDARLMSEAEQRLSTLRTTQEARIALNEGIDAVVRGEDVNLSPNSTEPLARVADDIAKMDMPVKAQDAVPTIPQAEADAALASVGHDIKQLEAKGVDTATVMRSASTEEAARAVQTGEIASLREQIATATKEQPATPEQVAAQSPDVPAASVAPEAKAAQVAVMAERLKTLEDHTAKGEVAPDLVKAVEDQRKAAPAADQNFAAPAIQKTQAVTRVNTPGAIDTSKPVPEPRAEGIKQAEASVAKPEDTKALAAQYSVDPATGAFPEEAQVAQLATEGRLTPDDAANLAQAEADYHAGASFGEALKSIVGCLL
jgi:hypothetical protein